MDKYQLNHMLNKSYLIQNKWDKLNRMLINIILLEIIWYLNM